MFENIRRRDVSLFGGISCGKLVFFEFEMFNRQALDERPTVWRSLVKQFQAVCIPWNPPDCGETRRANWLGRPLIFLECCYDLHGRVILCKNRVRSKSC